VQERLACEYIWSIRERDVPFGLDNVQQCAMIWFSILDGWAIEFFITEP